MMLKIFGKICLAKSNTKKALTSGLGNVGNNSQCGYGIGNN